jgi:hypothetical protein
VYQSKLFRLQCPLLFDCALRRIPRISPSAAAEEGKLAQTKAETVTKEAHESYIEDISTYLGDSGRFVMLLTQVDTSH